MYAIWQRSVSLLGRREPPARVKCWKNGPAVGEYAVWDQIVGHPSGVAYVHDLYVEMPKGSPAAEGIPKCGDTARPPAAPAPGQCVHGDFTQMYFSVARVAKPDMSTTRVEWEPQMCRQSDGWVLRSHPELKQTTPGNLFGIGIELSPARRLAADGSKWEYHGRVRQCIPFSIGYSVGPLGVGFSGAACVTLGTAKIRVEVQNGRAKASFPGPRTNGTAEFGMEFDWTRRQV